MFNKLKMIFTYPSKLMRRKFIGALRQGKLKTAAFIKTTQHLFAAIGLGYAAYQWSVSGAYSESSLTIKLVAFIVSSVLWLIYWYEEVYFWRKNLKLRPESPLNKLLNRDSSR